MELLVSFPDHLHSPHNEELATRSRQQEAITVYSSLKLTFKVLSELPLHKSLLSADHAI